MEMHEFILNKERKRYVREDFSLDVFKEAINLYFNNKTKQLMNNKTK